MQAKSYRNIFRVYQKQDNFSMKLELREEVISQTSFDHISINSSIIFMVSMAIKSPENDFSINASHILRRSILAKISGRSTDNHHGTVY